MSQVYKFRFLVNLILKKLEMVFLTYVQDYTIIMTLRNDVVYSNKHNLQTRLT